MIALGLCESCFAELERRQVMRWPSERRALLAVRKVLNKCATCRSLVPRLDMGRALQRYGREVRK